MVEMRPMAGFSRMCGRLFQTSLAPERQEARRIPHPLPRVNEGTHRAVANSWFFAKIVRHSFALVSMSRI